MTPAAILKRALSPLDSAGIGSLSQTLDIPREQIARASNGAHGQPTRAEYHLKLCAWLGVDPVTGEATQTERIVAFDRVQFALAVKMSRFSHGHSVREAAAVMKMSATVLTRIQHGEDYSFENVIAACRYGGLGLNNYVRPVSHETTRNTKAETRSAA